MKTTRSVFILALIATVVATLALPLFAAPQPKPPAPDEAPHGIANQAAESQPAKSTDSGPVAIPDATEKALKHARSGNWLWLLDQIWSLLVPGVILFTGFSAKLRDVAHRIGRNWYFTIVVYVVLFFTITFVIGFPLSYFTGYVRPHAYGLSNQTFNKWFGDELKGLMVGFVMGALLLWIPYLLVKKSPRRWWLWDSVIVIPLAP